MTQLDLFAPCTSPHVQVSTPTRTPPPSRWPSNDPELWATLPQGRPAVLELLRRRHAGDLDAMAADLERLQGPNPHVTREGEWDKGARYGAAHVLAWRLRNGKEVVA